MTKTELIRKAKISTNAMAHMSKNEDVRVEVLVKICGALGCTIDDIMEIIKDEKVITTEMFDGRMFITIERSLDDLRTGHTT